MADLNLKLLQRDAAPTKKTEVCELTDREKGGAMGARAGPPNGGGDLRLKGV